MGIKIDLIEVPAPSGGWSYTVTETGEPAFCMACGGEVATDLQGDPLCMHGPAYVVPYAASCSESVTGASDIELAFTTFCEPCGCDVPADKDGNRICEH